MTLQDSVNYIFFTNPLSQGVFSTVSSLARVTGLASSNKQSTITARAASNTTKVMSSALPLWRLAGANLHFVRMAGLSGAVAVILGAYGSHRKYPDDKGESKAIFETANRFHFFHSIALMAVPMVHRPLITGPLFIIGTLFFSGVLYYRAFTGNRKFSQLAPIGGFSLIVAWLSLLL